MSGQRPSDRRADPRRPRAIRSRSGPACSARPAASRCRRRRAAPSSSATRPWCAALRRAPSRALARPSTRRLDVVLVAGRRSAQDLADAAGDLRRAARRPLRPRQHGLRARRRRRRRPGRLRGRQLHARRRLRAGADDAARAGRLVGRRQDRHQPSRRQEHDRRVPPAAWRSSPTSTCSTRCRERELVAGLAEVIKYGAVADDAFLAWIEASLPALLARDKAALAQAVTRSCDIKAAIVGADERESGAARGPQLRPHLRACDRDRAPATAPGCTARRSAAAWRWPPTCRCGSA